MEDQILVRIFRIVCLLVLVSAEACAAGRVPAVRLGEDFVLQPGQAVEVEDAGFGIEFVAVLEDSRCPVDVTCFWAGNARVELRVRKMGSESQTVVLNTELEPKAAAIGSYELRLIALAPQRRADATIVQSEYAATLRVDKTPTE